jgi:hypothetical protein
MARLTQHFIWSNHDSGMRGWLVEAQKHNPTFTPGDGMTIAHDLLEHFKMDGTGEDECMAIGSIWYIRIGPGRMTLDMSGGTRQDDFVGSVLHDVLSDLARDSMPCLRHIRRPASRHLVIDDGEREAVREVFMRHSLRDTDLHEMIAAGEEDEPETFNDPEYAAWLEQWFDSAWNWLCRGYLKAGQRWKGRGSLADAYPAFTANDLFFELVKELNDEWTDDERFVEGDRLSIHVNCLRRSFNIVHTKFAQY